MCDVRKIERLDSKLKFDPLYGMKFAIEEVERSARILSALVTRSQYLLSWPVGKLSSTHRDNITHTPHTLYYTTSYIEGPPKLNT